MSGIARYLEELYEDNKATDVTISNAVEKDWITEAEYKQITGEDYATS